MPEEFNMRRVSFLLGVLFALMACDGEKGQGDVIVDETLRYMPLKVGSEWIYQVDSIVYDPEPGGLLIDTISEQLRVLVVDSFVNVEDEVTYTIERYFRENENSPWVIRDVWAYTKTRDFLLSLEENLSFMRLKFPLRANSAWDGLERIDADNVDIRIRGEKMDYFKFWDRFRVVSFQLPQNIGQLQLDDVITVNHVDREILIEKRYSEESYARDIGLVSRHIEILDTQNPNDMIPFEERAEKGFILHQELISFK